jgi:hypothetical protein
LFKNTPEIRRLLFGRVTLQSKSIFESILSNGLFSCLIGYIWNEFRLWEKPEILSLVSLNKLFKFMPVISQGTPIPKGTTLAWSRHGDGTRLAWIVNAAWIHGVTPARRHHKTAKFGTDPSWGRL